MGGVRVYWRRRGYRRLKPESRPVAFIRLGHRRPRLSWPRLNLLKIARLMSPKMWLAQMRDAYLDMMLRWSSSWTCPTGMVSDAGASAFGNSRLKEYDQKDIVEIYRLIFVAEFQGKVVMVEPVGRIPSRIPEEIEV